jgi:glycerophosphoryl diester phosphodiesterase
VQLPAKIAQPLSSAQRPLLLGHRGLRARGFTRLPAVVPVENSLVAFESALAQGCDGFEFDVRRTRDGRNVLWHDADFSGREIAASDLGDLAGREGNQLACLEDVLKQFGRSAYLDIELKVTGGEESVVAALRAHPPQRGLVVSSFLPEVVTRLHTLDDSLPLGFICDRDDAMRLWRLLPVKMLLPRHDLVRPQLIADVHRSGRQIMTWTVNSPRRMQELADWGIDGLISDDPAMLYQTFHNS